MGKFIYAVISVVIIEMALYFFSGMNYATTSLFGFIMNPTIENNLFGALQALVLGVATIALIAALYSSGNIYALYAGAIGYFILFISVAIELVSFVHGALVGHLQPEFTLMISMIIFILFGGYYLIACLEWVRFN